MPRNTCVVDGCPSKKTSIKMFRMPANDDLRAMWMEYLAHRAPLLRTLPRDQRVTHMVCRLHFEDKYIVNNRRVYLSAPTLFTAEEIDSGIPEKPFVYKNIGPLDEHNYFCNKQGYTDHTYAYIGFGDERKESNIYLDDKPTPYILEEAEQEDRPEDNEPIEVFEDIKPMDYPPIPLTDQPADPKPDRPQLNEMQYFINNFAKSIQNETNKTPPDNNERAAKLDDLLEAYNFSSYIIEANKEVKLYDDADLFSAEKAYAVTTYCLLKQKELFEDSIRDFLEWAANATISYRSVEKKILDTFANGELLTMSYNILKIICKIRLRNTELRKASILNQASEPEIEESLSKIGHSTTHLFNKDALKSVLSSVPKIHKAFPLKKLKITQTNMLPKKTDKAVQVPDRDKNAEKRVHVKTNKKDGIKTMHKVKRKDAIFQTLVKEILAGQQHLRERSENAEVSEANHCQKIMYGANIKKRLHPDSNATYSSKQERIEIGDQAGPRCTDFESQNVSEFSHIENLPDESSPVSKIKRKCIPRSYTSIPVRYGSQNLILMAPKEMARPVNLTLKKKTVRKRSSFGKKRGPKMPGESKGPQPSLASAGQSTSDSTHIHNHTSCNPQAENVPPSSMLKSTQVSSGGSGSPNFEVSRSVSENDVLKSSDIHNLEVKEVQNPVNVETKAANLPSSVTFSLTYDNVLKWHD